MLLSRWTTTLLLLLAPLSVLGASNNDTGDTAASTSSSGKTITGYFPNWLYARWPVTNIDFSKYTHINYAFAIMTKGNTPIWPDEEQTKTQLPELVKAAHAKKAKVLISIGGWSGCVTFSTMAASAAGRKAFINWSLQQIKTYGIDGIDIDWEYPGRQGAGCNAVDEANDAKNFLSLLQELRKALGNSKELTAAVHVRTFDTPSGNMKDVSAYAKVLTRVNLMTYDINGAWNTTSGPNAPFKFAPGHGDADSFVSAIDNWMKAGMPANKISPGLAFYGRAVTTTQAIKNNLYQPQLQGQVPKGDSYDAFWQDPYCSKDPGGNSGIWRYGNLRSQGVLKSPTQAASPWVRQWDNVTQTPWLLNSQTKMLISYDDPNSIAVKVNYAACKGLGGLMVWSVDEDSKNNELLNEVAKIKSGKTSSSGKC